MRSEGPKEMRYRVRSQTMGLPDRGDKMPTQRPEKNPISSFLLAHGHGSCATPAGKRSLPDRPTPRIGNPNIEGYRPAGGASQEGTVHTIPRARAHNPQTAERYMTARRRRPRRATACLKTNPKEA